MKKLQSYQFQLKPFAKQERLQSFAGSCRFVYNKALALQKERYEQGEKNLTYFDLCRLLTDWKKSIPWLKEAPSQVLISCLNNLDRAYSNFFAGRAAPPKFKKRGRSSSFRYPASFKLDQVNGRIYLPKLGWIRYYNSRKVLGTVKNVTVSLSNEKWYISIQTEREVEVPVHTGSAIGIDMGITRFATCSDGSYVEPINSLRKKEAKIKKEQRIFARKVKFSNNWRKQKRKIQRIYKGIANSRLNFLHKISIDICKNHAIVIIEDLNIKNMSRSAKGTIEQPGTNVKSKSGLNKSILDQGWYEFKRQLEYKTRWNGGCLVTVPPAYTSQKCSICDYGSAKNRTSQAKFKCLACNNEENADLNAAKNILRAGLARLACGEISLGISVKQEPPLLDSSYSSSYSRNRLSVGEEVKKRIWKKHVSINRV